jgi:response regulator of citrate/malate metabolism
MKKKVKRDRKVKKGFDIEKMSKIWNALNERKDWMYINEISRETKINNVTVRWYLDHYLKDFIEERRLSDTIRLRFVKLKENITLEGVIRAIKIIKSIRGV